MRFRGGGVGHKSTREATNIFRSDRYAHDLAGTQWHDIVNPADVAAEPSTTAGDADDENAGGGGHEVERAEGGEGEDDAGGENGDNEDIYLEEEIEQRWRQEREAITAAQSQVEYGAEDDDAESVSGESSNASETSSKYDGDDIPQDILGPEDGQGEVNEIDNLGYANL